MTTVLDADSARWLTELRSQGQIREQALARLHAMLHRVTRAEAARRRGSLPPDIAGDVDHLCLQAANDAMVAILGKLDRFRGASWFTTWVYKFAVVEVSACLRTVMTQFKTVKANGISVFYREAGRSLESEARPARRLSRFVAPVPQPDSGARGSVPRRLNAELHRLDTGHFAIEDSLGVVATNIRRFHDEKVAVKAAA